MSKILMTATSRIHGEREWQPRIFENLIDAINFIKMVLPDEYAASLYKIMGNGSTELNYWTGDFDTNIEFLDCLSGTVDLHKQLQKRDSEHAAME